MTKISVTIITFNEENNIKECLESVSWADEIVIVDSFSTDKTVEICKKYTDIIHQNKFPGHIKQKNIAIEMASHPWIFSLDADERVSKPLQEEILLTLQNGTEKSGFSVPRKSFYLGRWINHSGWYPNRNVRFFKKEKGKWEGVFNLHESVTVQGAVGKLSGNLLHHPYRDISHNLSTIDNFTSIMANGMKSESRKTGLFDLVFRPPLTFFKKYFLNKGFKDGIPGFIICTLTAYYVFCKYAKLWELNKTKQ